MKNLIEKFYESIRTGGPTPISHREILLTAAVMDDIFRQLGSQISPLEWQEKAVGQGRRG